MEKIAHSAVERIGANDSLDIHSSANMHGYLVAKEIGFAQRRAIALASAALDPLLLLD